MDLYYELLIHLVKKERIQVTFPDLNIDPNQMISDLAFQALKKIKAILQDDSLEDPECFYKIEEIVCAFESLDCSCGPRHDFG